MVNLEYYRFDLNNILLNLPRKEKFAVIEELLDNVLSGFGKAEKEVFLKQFYERENKGSTALQKGLAVPHIKSREVDQVHLAVGYYPSGIEFNALDGSLVKVVVLSIVPVECALVHLRFLSQLSMSFLNEEQGELFAKPKDKESVYQFMIDKIRS